MKINRFTCFKACIAASIKTTLFLPRAVSVARAIIPHQWRTISSLWDWWTYSIPYTWNYQWKQQEAKQQHHQKWQKEKKTFSSPQTVILLVSTRNKGSRLLGMKMQQHPTIAERNMSSATKQKQTMTTAATTATTSTDIIPRYCCKHVTWQKRCQISEDILHVVSFAAVEQCFCPNNGCKGSQWCQPQLIFPSSENVCFTFARLVFISIIKLLN